VAGQIQAAAWLRPYDESGTAVTSAAGRRFRWIPASVPALFADLAAMRPEADAAELIVFARGALADFKVPQFIDVRSDPLPRNAGGKVSKPSLRDETRWGRPLWLPEPTTERW
jgi:acyl-CoA synthetase (AMP-forming)/AMP-acid ligase II